MKHQLGLLLRPYVALRSLIANQSLITGLVRRDFIGRYRGSLLGILWSFFNPVLMLSVYTVVFNVAFKARWSGVDESKSSFALLLFSGMIVHSLFAESLNRAPMLILQHVNFVKKVVFPLEILPVVTVLSALLHFLISFVVLCVFFVVAGFPVHSTLLFAPLVLCPLLLTVLGLSWFLSALGVYLKDLSQLISFLTSVSLFLSPVFYATETLPEDFQRLLFWNPITLPILQLRDVMIFGKNLDWWAWGASLGIGLVLAWFGYAFFQRVRRGFADVL